MKPLNSLKTVCIYSLFLATAVLASAQNHTNQANWALAKRFSRDQVIRYLYSTDIEPQFINKSDRFWYFWKAQDGVFYYLVDPKKKSQKLLFDRDKMAARVSELTSYPFDGRLLTFKTIKFDEVEEVAYLELELVDKATKPENPNEPKKILKTFEYNLVTEIVTDATEKMLKKKKLEDLKNAVVEKYKYAEVSPDKKSYVYAKDHNLYYGETDSKAEPIQITKDGEKNYSFGEVEETDAKERRKKPTVTWSKDSTRFWIERDDMRKISDLFIIDSLNMPRPKLKTYKYAMPGEKEVPQEEYYVFTRATKTLEMLPTIQKWKDQVAFNIEWESEKNSNSLRFIRRDRPRRNLEYCEIEIDTKKVRVILTEKSNLGFLEDFQKAFQVSPGGDFLWMSKRTGWQHLYRYDRDGKLKNAVTEGPWNVADVIKVDDKSKTVWFTARGKEQDQNPYYSDAYRMKVDSTNLVHLTPSYGSGDWGDETQKKTLSPSLKYLVYGRSRINMPTETSVFDEKGNPVLLLQRADLTPLLSMGWKAPEPFSVKAEDKITDLYGNLFKPADFDPNKKYPIIVYVYPGPQSESVTSRFIPLGQNQMLAQLGFIVIEVGNRGGSPQRSEAYHTYGYMNLRDYGLADKKFAVEQLASRYSWIDINRVGIYGHSGGGFMTATALLLPPYNEFFKAGVASAGNYDNNIYNFYWGERHHGLFELPVKDKNGKVVEGQTQFEIKIPTTAELAPNLKGSLMLIHGEIDDNVHPAGMMRLVDALIKANKRFDMLVLPGSNHFFKQNDPYYAQRMMEFFSEHLLGDYYRGQPDINVK